MVVSSFQKAVPSAQAVGVLWWEGDEHGWYAPHLFVLLQFALDMGVLNKCFQVFRSVLILSLMFFFLGTHCLTRILLRALLCFTGLSNKQNASINATILLLSGLVS